MRSLPNEERQALVVKYSFKPGARSAPPRMDNSARGGYNGALASEKSRKVVQPWISD